VDQENLRTKSWVCLGAVSAGIHGISRASRPGVVARGVFNDSARPVEHFLGSSGHTGSFCPVFPIFTTEGEHPRDSRDHDKGNRRSWKVEKNDPGRIRQAGHEPEGRVHAIRKELTLNFCKFWPTG